MEKKLRNYFLEQYFKVDPKYLLRQFVDGERDFTEFMRIVESEYSGTHKLTIPKPTKDPRYRECPNCLEYKLRASDPDMVFCENCGYDRTY